MSTYWGYVCKSHEPPIESEHWFNHGEVLLTATALAFRAGAWEFNEWGDPAEVDHRGWRTREPIRWLQQHPHCVVWVRNEYGDEYDPGEESL